MERNHIIGFLLIFATLFVWSYLNKPDEAELERRKQMQDSIARVEAAAIEELNEDVQLPTSNPTVVEALPDSVIIITECWSFWAFRCGICRSRKDIHCREFESKDLHSQIREGK